ncbi:MAG: hypothetical protein Q9221_006539 [Calogaya cf. arnoldii]
MADSSFRCNQCWEPPNIFRADEGDDDWMYCNAREAGPNFTSSNRKLDHSQPQADPWAEHPSPRRNPESPLDQEDLDRFQRRTAVLAANTQCSLDPVVDFLATGLGIEPRPIGLDLPLLSDPQSLLTLCQSLEKRLADLEHSKEELVKSLDQDIEEIRDLLMEVTEAVTSAEVTPECNSPQCDEESFDDSDTIFDFGSPCTTPQNPTPEAYVQAWCHGGLVIVENLSDHARTRDIHALFKACGTITYLELHGPDKSKPHINSRYAYVHFAEYYQAVIAVQNHHGVLFQDKVLMVFLLSTDTIDTVRGEPGVPYLGSALEVLNFAGGENYASPQADFRQEANQDIQKLLERLDITALLQHSGQEPSTYSLKPNLTAKMDAPWRRTDTPTAELEVSPKIEITAKVPSVEPSQQTSHALTAEIKPLAVGQPGAYVPPKTWKRKASSITGTDDTDSSRPHPVMKVLKRGEPLPHDIFQSGMINRQGSNLAHLAAGDFVHEGEQQACIS